MSTPPEKVLTSESLVTNNNGLTAEDLLAASKPVLGEREDDTEMVATVAALDTNAGTTPDPDYWTTYKNTSIMMSNDYDPWSWVKVKAEMQAPVTASKRLNQGAQNVARGFESPDTVADDLRGLATPGADPFLRAEYVNQHERRLSNTLKAQGVTDIQIDETVKSYFDRKMLAKMDIDPNTGQFSWDIGAVGRLAKETLTAIIIPFRSTETIAAMDSLMKSDREVRPLLGTDPWDGWNTYKKMYDTWWKLPSTRRLELANDVHRIMDSLSRGNFLLYSSLIAPFGDEAEINWLKFDIATDVVSYIPGARAGILSRLKTMRVKGNANAAIRGLDKLGDTAKAKAYAINLTDPAKVRAVGVDPNAVIEEGTPLLSGIFPLKKDMTPPPVPETMRTLDQNLADRAEEMASMSDRIDWRTKGYVTESVGRVVAEKAVEGLKGTYPRLLKADITEVDGTGFTIVATRADDTPLGMTADQVSSELFKIESELGSVEARAELLRFRTKTPGQLSGIEDIGLLKSELKMTESRYDALISRREQLWQEEVAIREADKTPIVETKRVSFGVDEQGVFEAKLPKGSRWMSSNDVIFRDIDKNLVGEATRLDFANTAQRETITRMWKEANRGLGLFQKNVLNKIELAGDKVGKIFTVGELQTQGLKGPAIESYYLRRALYDKFHFLENAKERRKLDFDGFKYSRLIGVAKGKKSYTEVFLRPFKEEGEFLPRGVTRIYDPDKRGIIDVDRKVINKKIENGYQVYKFKTRVDTGEELIEYAIMKADTHIGELPTQVLGYRKGYVPLIRTDANWIVNEIKPYKLNGETTHIGKTVRVFDNAYDAKLYAATSSPKDANATYRAMEAGALDAEGVSKKADIHISGQGGLFDAERSEEIVYKGFLNEEANRLNSTDAFEAYLDHISLRYPLNEFRMHLTSKFLNTYTDNLTDPNDWMSPLKNSEDVLASDAETVRNKIRSVLYLRSNEERWFNEKLNQVANSLGSGKWGKHLAPAVEGFKNVDVVGAIRSSTFYAFLGFYNPRQLIIQGLGGTVAVAVDPKYGTLGYLRYMAMRPSFYLHGSADEPIKSIWAHAAGRAVGLSPEEYNHSLNLFRKSGIHESVRGTHADFASASSGSVISPSAMRVALDNSLMPWREGELSLRGGAYFIAQARKASTLKRGILDLTEEMNEEIIKDSVRMTMNLNRANAAEINKGFPGISTQFWQIMMKFYENTMPNFMPGTARNFTGMEKARIWAFNTAAFGLAGIPTAEWMYGEFYGFLEQRRREGSEAAQTIFDMFELDDQEWRRIYRGGLMEKAMRDGFGLDVDLASRASIPAGYQELIKNLMDTDYSTLELLAGASGAFGLTVEQNLSESLKIMGFGNAEVGFTPEVAYQGILTAAKSISSVNNATRAHFMWEKQKLVAYKKGKPDEGLYSRDIDPTKDFMSVVGQAIGFPMREIQDEIEKNVFAAKYEKQIVDGYVEAYLNHFKYSYPAGGYSSQAEKDAFSAAAMALLPADDPIRGKVLSRINNESTVVYDAIKRQNDFAEAYYVEGPFNAQLGDPLSHISDVKNIVNPTSMALNPMASPEQKPKE